MLIGLSHPDAPNCSFLTEAIGEGLMKVAQGLVYSLNYN